MSRIVTIVNGPLTALFDLLLRPFGGLHPVWPLLVVSLATGVLMLWIFGKISNQKEVGRIRDLIRGNLLAIRIFGDDVGLLLRLQGRILRSTATYMRHALVPMLVMLIPVMLVLIQLNLRYSARPLRPGESTTVTAKLRSAPGTETFTLEAPEGLSVETPPVRVDETREVSWRIRAEAPGSYRLRIAAGGEPVEKLVRVADHGWASVPTRRSSKALDLLLYPGESRLDAGAPVESIQVAYEYLPIRVFGFHLNWLFLFFVASIAFGFAFKKPLGVEI